MAKVYDGIDAELAAWIERQPVFFVGKAPLAADGLVNVSPKGGAGTFRVVDDHTFAYLDLGAVRLRSTAVGSRRPAGRRRAAPPGSGIETVAHLRENGRLCVWRTRDDERIAAYHAARNATSLDGLPGLPAGGQL